MIQTKLMAVKQAAGAVALLVALAAPTSLHAALSHNVEVNGWPNTAHRDAAVNALQSAVNRYNAYGNFGNYNVYAYYNSGIPTAQASYQGSIGYGGTYPNERVTMHEMSHYLGTGTYGTPWDGARGEGLIDQFDGLEASLNGDGAHYWPYGLNYDSEGAEVNKQRHVALLYAMRADMGIGSTGNPTAWAATAVNLTASDAGGESGFNYGSKWSDNTFAHTNANYSTGAFSMRTPEGYNSWTFAGNSLTVNPSGRLLYNGWGTTGVVTIKNLTVNGGTVRHDQFSQDLFQLAGNVTLASTATFEAANGDIKVLAPIGGSGSLTKTGSYSLTLTGINNYTGATTINAGTLRLAAAAVASYTFDNVSGSTVVNGGNGGTAMNGTLAGGATVVAGGQTGNAVSLAGGASVNINNPIADLGNTSSWTVSAWVKTTTPGASILTKGDGSGWVNGNTIFYLGDGTAGGSGGIPSAVRFAGGFYQQSVFAPQVNDGNWHLVTYVNNGGSYAIYTDGVAQALSGVNNSFSNADVGSVVRLGVSTNTFAGDGTVNFNGLLDSVQFYNQALSAAQVAALYQGTSATPLPTTTNVTIASGATLDVNGISQQIGSLTGVSGSAVTLGSGQLIVSSAASTQFSGIISGAGGSFVKAGTGTLSLTNANSYSGGTTINGGTLRVNNAFGTGTGSGAVTVNSGGTLGGTGFITGAVAVNSGAHIAPGASIESLNVGSLTLAAGSILDFELDTVSGTDTSDLINVTTSNAFTINGGILNLTNLGSMTGGTYKLIDYSGTLNRSISNLSLGVLPAGFIYSLINNTLLTSIDLVVSPQLLGDYNNDGAVDAADYVMWQENVGQPAGTLPNDNTGVAIGGQQFTLWRSNFGNVPGSGSALGSAAVPEPASVVIALVGLSTLLFVRRQR